MKLPKIEYFSGIPSAIVGDISKNPNALYPDHQLTITFNSMTRQPDTYMTITRQKRKFVQACIPAKRKFVVKNHSTPFE